jgi:hypothetical protein
MAPVVMPRLGGFEEFARRAAGFGHGLAELERGVEIETYTQMPTVAASRATTGSHPQSSG